MKESLSATSAILLLALFAAHSQAEMILIDGTGPDYVLNGSFESTTNGNPDNWVPTEFDHPGFASDTDGTNFMLQANTGAGGGTDGTGPPHISQVFGLNVSMDSVGQAPGIDTGHTIQLGDVFTLSFDHRGRFNWDDGDELDWELFYTNDGTIGGTRTSVAAGSVGPIGASFTSTGPLVSAPADASAAGNTLFLAFTPGAGAGFQDDGQGGTTFQNEFGRIDQVNLTVQVIPEPSSFLLVLGLGVVALGCRRIAA